MSDERLEERFLELIGLPPEVREARLAEIFPEGGPGRDEIVSLLVARDSRPGFLDPPARRAPSTPLARLGKYRVLGELGRGGAGIVYLGEDPDLGRQVAIKILALSLPDGGDADRLRREGRAIAAVQHPNVAQVYTVESGCPLYGGGAGMPIPEEGCGLPPEPPPAAFLTLEYVPGESLVDRLRAGPMDLEPALDCARQIAAALEAAHRRSVLHRDLKPQNIKFTADGWVKVLDFGLARVLEAVAEDDGKPGPVTAPAAGEEGFVAEDGVDGHKRVAGDVSRPVRRGRPASAPHGGTPGYMSPEQCRGEDLDARTDLWSFGAVLYECLAGRPAIPADDLEELLARNLDGRIDFGAVPPQVPEPVRDLLRVCLDPDRRARVLDATAARRILEDELLRLRAGSFLAPGAEAGAASSRRRAGEGVPPEEGPADAPPAPARGRGNLPVPLTRFIGREALLGELESLVGVRRLITLTGPGGVGKTRTALQLAARMAPRLPGGTWFVDLSELDAGADLAAAVARALRLREVRGAAEAESLAAVIARAFAARPGLLLLDNCEHVLAAASDVAQSLLAGATSLTIVATSRQPLGVPGEHVTAVTPFAVPTPDTAGQAVAPAGVSAAPLASEAVDLFVQRARARAPRFAPTAGELSVIGDLCRRLDGLPLAIELAASHLAFLSLEEIRRRVLAGKPIAAAGTSAASSPRHRTIHDLVDWSYRLLRPDQQTLFRRLSVFRGGWTLAGAEAVCSGDGIEDWQVYEMLVELIERSLVQVRSEEPTERADGSPESDTGIEACSTRYGFLETVRSFAAQRVAETEGEQAILEDRFLVHLLATTEERPAEQGPTCSAWVRRIEPDYANVLHGIELALERREIGTACALAARLGPYWLQTGYWIEGFRWMERILRERGATKADVDPRLEIALLIQAARLAATLGNNLAADGLIAEAMEKAERLGEVGPRADALLTAGICAWFRTDLETARSCYEQSRPLFERTGDRRGLATCVANLGVIHSVKGEHEIARAMHEEHRRLSRESGDTLSEAKALLNLARTAIILGAPETARVHLEEAIPLLREHRDLHALAQAWHSLGDLDLGQGRHDEARASLLESGRLRLRVGDRRGLTSVLGSLARLESAAGDPRVAVAVFAGILHLLESGAVPALPGFLEDARLAFAAAQGRLAPEVAAAWVARGTGRSVEELLTLAARDSSKSGSGPESR